MQYYINKYLYFINISMSAAWVKKIKIILTILLYIVYTIFYYIANIHGYVIKMHCDKVIQFY